MQLHGVPAWQKMGYRLTNVFRMNFSGRLFELFESR